ncbi:MAG: hypothetical protein AAGF48_15990 [Pseudomonadota bacterium]
MASHFDCLVAIGIRPEHLFEQFSEPSFEDIDLFWRDRNIVRPIIYDPPLRQFVHDGTAARFRLGQFAVVVEINAWA